MNNPYLSNLRFLGLIGSLYFPVLSVSLLHGVILIDVVYQASKLLCVVVVSPRSREDAYRTSGVRTTALCYAFCSDIMNCCIVGCAQALRHASRTTLVPMCRVLAWSPSRQFRTYRFAHYTGLLFLCDRLHSTSVPRFIRFQLCKHLLYFAFSSSRTGNNIPSLCILES